MASRQRARCLGGMTSPEKITRRTLVGTRYLSPPMMDTKHSALTAQVQLLICRSARKSMSFTGSEKYARGMRCSVAPVSSAL